MSTAPKPEVVYLQAIFREIRQGKTRIPAFQRGFVWTQRQVLELLDSVYRSYPIGSLLFWNTDVDQMRTDDGDEVPFPHPEIAGPVDFVLDGLQRVSTLYGAFHRWTDGGGEDPFDVTFDLSGQTFRHADESSDTSINLRVLFTPRELLAEQARLGELVDGDELIDRSLQLQRAFQEYLLPVVRIGDRNPQEVVEIFERVNSTGTRLGAVDFMRALTWSTDFDLSEHLDELGVVASRLGYVVPTDTLAKLIALTLEVVPTGSEMLQLRDAESAALHRAVFETRQSIEIALGFLTEELGFLSYDYVPYEGQFLVLASVAAATQGHIPPWLRGWFWRVSFCEAMQGRPDTTIARMVLRAREDPLKPLQENFSLAVDDLKTRAVRKGTALSMAVVAAMATRPARSVLSGNDIDLQAFMASFDQSCLGAVFSSEELQAAVGPTARANRVIANIVLLDSAERRPAPTPSEIRASVLELSETSSGLAALDTQCVSAECVAAIRSMNARAFIDSRSRSIMELASMLSGADTP